MRPGNRWRSQSIPGCKARNPMRGSPSTSTSVVRLVYLARLREAFGCVDERLRDRGRDDRRRALGVAARARRRVGARSSRRAARCASRSTTTLAARRRSRRRRRRGRALPAGHRRLTDDRPHPVRAVRRQARGRRAARTATARSARSRRSSAPCATSTTATPSPRLTLEHYPGMTEKALAAIVGGGDGALRHRRRARRPSRRRARAGRSDRARRRHERASRRGVRRLPVHHGLPEDARAVLEEGATPQGARWVEARASDDDAAARWYDRRG